MMDHSNVHAIHITALAIKPNPTRNLWRKKHSFKIIPKFNTKNSYVSSENNYKLALPGKCK